MATKKSEGVKRWILLRSVPGDELNYAHGFQVAYFETDNTLFVVKGGRPGIFHYSFDTNTWIARYQCPNLESEHGESYYLSWRAAAILSDKQKKKIFVNHKQGKLAIYSLNDQTQAKLEILRKMDGLGNGYGAKGIIIHNEFHIIRGEENKHIKYDLNTKQAHILHDFKDELQGIQYHEIVRIKNKILMMGGEVAPNTTLDSIYEYDIDDNTWTRLNYTLPACLGGFGCVLILNGQYMAIFGGDAYNVDYDDIYLYSVRDKEFEKLKLKCPKKVIIKRQQ